MTIFRRRATDPETPTTVSLAIAEDTLARLAELAEQAVADGSGFIQARDISIEIGACWIKLEKLKCL